MALNFALIRRTIIDNSLAAFSAGKVKPSIPRQPNMVRCSNSSHHFLLMKDNTIYA
jgi:hypothetical protein